MLFNVAAEMGDVIERRLVVDLPGASVTDDGRFAEIAHMIGPALLVQGDVPVDKRFIPAFKLPIMS